MTRLRLHLVSATLLAAAGFGSETPAWAQPPASAAVAGLDKWKEADRLFAAGKTAYKAKKLQEAYEAYRDAWKLNQTYDICSNLANVEVELGKRDVAGMKRAAAETYAHCIRLFPHSDKKLAAAQTVTLQRFQAARADVAALAIDVNVPGADVFIDNLPAGKAPLDGEVYVDPGEHTVEARLTKYEMTPQKVQAVKATPIGNKPADAQCVALVLTPVPEPVDKPPEPEANAGKPTPPVPAVDTTPRKDEQPPPPPPPRLNKAIVISGAAITGAAVVAGVTLVVVANAKGSSADALVATLKQAPGPPVCQTFASTCSAVNTDRTAHDALSNAAKGVFVGAGAVGLATLGYALLAPKSQPTAGVRLLPAIGWGQGGVMLAGSW